MGLHKFTHEQLLIAHRKREIKLMHANVKIKTWKKRALEAEAITEEYAFIDKKPDYFYSFTGLLLFRRFYLRNGLTANQVEILIIISYCGVFLRKDFKLFSRNYVKRPIFEVLDSLVKQGYVIATKIPSKAGTARRNAWILTQRGKDLEADYERYYDQKMDELKAGKLTPFNFEDGAYFRKVYVTRHDRRKAQGGGMLPRSGTHVGPFRDPFMEKQDEKT